MLTKSKQIILKGKGAVMRKSLIVILIVILMDLVFFSACSEDDSEILKEDTPDLVNDLESGQVVFPLKEQITLTAFVHTKPTVENFNESALTKKIEEMTNINLEFVVVSANEAQERLNLSLSTGDYPDLILIQQLSLTIQSLYGSQGTLIPLNDLIDKYGDNTKEVFEAFPVAKDRALMLDGNIYNLPRIEDSDNLVATQKMWIYQPWLEKLNLEMPTTTEAFYEVLTAFATQDPNGNGIADEIPYAGAINGWDTQAEAFLMNAFVYNATGQSSTKWLYVEEGKVTPSFTQNGWKEGLKYLQRLRKEGLMAQESFTQGIQGLKQMGENPERVILGAFPGGYQGTGTNLSGDRWSDYVAVPPLMGPEGVQLVKYNPFASVTSGASITDTCKHPEIAFALLDLLYEESLSISNGMGIEGYGWAYNDDDAKKGFDGEKAIWSVLIEGTAQEANSFWKMGNTYITSEINNGGYYPNPNSLGKVIYEETVNKYEPYYPSIDTLMPPLAYSEAQSEKILTYSLTINDYVREKITEFIITDIDIDTAWPVYMSELDAMGIEEMIAVYQEAYEADKNK